MQKTQHTHPHDAPARFTVNIEQKQILKGPGKGLLGGGTLPVINPFMKVACVD